MAKEAPFRHQDGSNCWHEDCKTDERRAKAKANREKREADKEARAIARAQKAAQREQEIAARKAANPGGARQGHGFKNEERIKEKYGLQKYTDVKSNDYTSTYDAVAPNGKPVSIKTEGLGSNVELGDYFRNANANEDFYMVVSFWQGDKDNIVEEYKVLVPADEWAEHFDRNFDDKIKTLISEASNDESYDEEWKRRRLALNEEYGADQFIRLRPKRDHKKQKRMQAAIDYKDFVKFAENYKTEDFEKWDKDKPVL